MVQQTFFPRIQTTDLESPVKEIVYTRRTRMGAPINYCSEFDLIFKQGPNNFKPVYIHSCLNLRSCAGQNIKISVMNWPIRKFDQICSICLH